MRRDEQGRMRNTTKGKWKGRSGTRDSREHENGGLKILNPTVNVRMSRTQGSQDASDEERKVERDARKP